MGGGRSSFLKLSSDRTHERTTTRHCKQRSDEAIHKLKFKLFLDRTHERTTVRHCERLAKQSIAFSLIELMISLIVISCIAAAFTPIITKKLKSSMVVAGSVGGNYEEKSFEIDYDSDICTPIAGEDYCEGTFEVPRGVVGDIQVTLVGAGGGGGGSATAGLQEFKTAGEHTFSTTPFIGKIETTLVSGGGGGAAGNNTVATPVTFSTAGVFKDSSAWTTPEALKGQVASVMGCAGGGGGAAAWAGVAASYGGTGGAGGYRTKPIGIAISLATTKIPYQVGGGGGGGSNWEAASSGLAGNCGGGGDGGSDEYNIPTNTCAVKYGGKGGTDINGAHTAPTGGSSNGEGADGESGSVRTSPTGEANGGTGHGGGNGGNGGELTGGGGSISGGGGGGKYGGGGGGGSGVGGGGGGGGPTYFNSKLIASGGGGGGGMNASGNWGASGGGGGGGEGGGNGGAGGVSTSNSSGFGGYGGTPGKLAAETNGSTRWNATYVGDAYTVLYGSSRCGGGIGGSGSSWGATKAKSGYDGIIKINYLDYSNGGTGGGGASLVPIQNLNVNASTNYTVTVGKGGSSTAKGSIHQTSDSPATDSVGQLTDAEAGFITLPADLKDGVATPSYTISNSFTQRPKPADDTYGQPTLIKLSSSTLLTTQKAYPGCPGGVISGDCGKAGLITNGLNTTAITKTGFTTSNGSAAASTSAKSKAGDGGAVTLFASSHSGGTATATSDGNSGSAYGVGGAGGYTFKNGGAGAPGYARISWNKTWNTSTKAYDLADKGAGGSGAGGNILTISIRAHGGERIPFRVGKGGDGGIYSSGTVAEAKAGGDTKFYVQTDGSAKYIAGGGGGGGFPTVVSNNLVNGVAGVASAICTAASGSSPSCEFGKPGDQSANADGAKGAISTYTVTGIILSLLVGDGAGEGGSAGSNADYAKGGDATGIGTGGGGAALYDLGLTSKESTTAGVRGGKGGNGRIVVYYKN